MKRQISRVALCALLVGAAGCDDMNRAVGEAFSRRGGDAVGDTPDRVQQQLGQVPAALDTTAAARLSAAFRGAAAQALPAVVQITTIALADVPAQVLPFNPEPLQQRTQGSGSGFIFDERGYILTNHHVVRNALNVNVVLLDGREFRAEVIGSDASTDVAVIRIDASGQTLPVIEMGDSDQLRVGDWVLALGNPMGLAFTATAGIVSAKSRTINILLQASDTPLEAFIQTDAAINPGNSGGPLVDLHGRVIGINTAIESGTGYFTGAGFAIPILLARKVAEDLVEHGAFHRPRLGVEIDDVSAADAEVYGLSAIRGVEITSVTPGTPADRAGLQLGDVILTLDGAAVNTLADLQARVARYRPGDDLRISFVRYGRDMTTTVQLGEFEVAQTAPPRAQPQRERNPLGFNVTALPAQIATRMGLRGENIPVVTRIDPLGPAASSQLFQGDVIRRFNNREIRTIRDLERAASAVRTGEVISLIVLSANRPEPAPKIVNYRAQ